MDLVEADASDVSFGNAAEAGPAENITEPVEEVTVLALNISGVKFNDLNGNGIQDDDEPGLPGWTITLVAPDGTETSTTTADDGSYRFEGLAAGSYTVSEVSQDGWTPTAPDTGSQTVDLAEVNATDVSFGNVEEARPPEAPTRNITGFKFNDLNGNGVRDADEPGLAGWTINLVAPDGTETSTTTAEDGSYMFEGLAAGSYTISEESQSGWTPIAPDTGSQSVNLSDADAADVSFGNAISEAPPENITEPEDDDEATPLALNISGVKFNDLNGNGVRDADEPGLAGWTITLVAPDGTETSTTTADDGSYRFSGLMTRGTYMLSEVPQTGWSQTAPANGMVTMANADVTDLNFGNMAATFRISGRAFKDQNGDGTDDGEPGLAGWTVRLSRPDGTETTASTDEGGFYRFEGLTPGTYELSEVLQEGWTQTAPADGSYTVNLTETDVMSRDFGNRGSTFSISGVKFNDLNGNGANDGEPGLAGWTITLVEPDGTERSATTADDGSYMFEGLAAGSYTVSEVLQEGWTATAPAGGSYSVELKDADVTDQDFGNYGSRSISGTKFYDLNGNGVKDAGEDGLAGWTIKLEQNGNVTDVATTAEDGSYSFSELSPQEYTVSEVPLDGWVATAPASGSKSVSLTDEDATGIDFGNRGNLSISGKKFYDQNDNGAQDEDEPGIPDAEVKLMEGARLITTTTTDEDGTYTFENIAPGTYIINDPPPGGFVMTTSSSITVTVTSSVVISQNFGLTGTRSISGMKFLDTHNLGTKDADETGISGWGIVLDGTTTYGGIHVTLSTTTGTDGSYRFDGLVPGTYKISELSRGPSWHQTFPSGDGSHTVTIVGSDVTGKDFGNSVDDNSISGVKYNDLNGNGKRDPDEPGMAGWTIKLLGAVNDTKVTGQDGSYIFTGLNYGTYTLQEEPQAKWTAKEPSGGSYTVTLDAANKFAAGKDFGNYNAKPVIQSLSPSPASPRKVGTQITWTATATDAEGDQILYKFLVNGVAKTDWTTNNVWTWATSGQAPGTYNVEVWVKDGKHSIPKQWDDKKSVSFKLDQANRPPVVRFLYTDRPSPQYAGSWVRWTAAAWDPDREPILYRFLLRGRSTGYAWVDMTGWTRSSSWIWRTSPADIGLSDVMVQVRDGHHASPAGYDDRAWSNFQIFGYRPNQPPMITSFSATPSGVQTAGTTIRVTASAVDLDGGPVYYKFLLKGPSTGNLWRTVQDWSTANAWTWRTTSLDVGQSQVEVRVRDGFHAPPSGWDDAAGTYITIKGRPTPPNQPPYLSGLAPNKASPQKEGTSIVWTATASDSDGDTLLYKFWLKGPSTGNAWTVVQEGTSRTWTWSSTYGDAGLYDVYVYVRDGKHEPAGRYDSARGYGDYQLTPANRPPTVTALLPNPPGPTTAGSTVVWTASASDPDGDALQYKFWLKGPSTGNAWTVVQDWSTIRTWTWSSAYGDAGEYNLYVYVRDGKHEPAGRYDSAVGYSGYQLVSRGGIYQLTSGIVIEDRPSLVSSAAGHLLAYQSWETGAFYSGDIFLKKFDLGWSQTETVQATGDTAYQDTPSAIYADGYYYVAYVSDEMGSWDIFVKKYDADLFLIETRRLTTSAEDQDRPSLIKVGNNFYLAYQSWETGPAFGGDIFIERFNSAWTSTGKVRVTTETSYQDRPSIARGDDDRIYVAYASEESGNRDVFVKKFDLNLNILDKKRITTSSSAQDYPSLIWQNGEFDLVYSSDEGGSYDLYLERFNPSWGLIDRARVTGTPGDEIWPALSYSPSDGFVWVAYVLQEGEASDIFVQPARPLDEMPSCWAAMDFNANSAYSPYALTLRFYGPTGALTDPSSLRLTWSPADAVLTSSTLQRVSTGTYVLESRFGSAGLKTFTVSSSVAGCSAESAVMVLVT
ncbi:MAG TPA: SdrD B-like domain-containing protein [Methanothrix sp.]|nr:SdrD B-like domain-containing protein [Methanothrix sp.]